MCHQLSLSGFNWHILSCVINSLSLVSIGILQTVYYNSKCSCVISLLGILEAVNINTGFSTHNMLSSWSIYMCTRVYISTHTHIVPLYYVYSDAFTSTYIHTLNASPYGYNGLTYDEYSKGYRHEDYEKNCTSNCMCVSLWSCMRMSE